MLKVQFINPFLKAAYRVLEAETGAVIEKGKMTIEDAYYTTNDITSMIGVVGDVQGTVLYGFSEKTAKELVSVMMGKRVAIIDSLAESAVGELGNMITGVAMAEMERANYNCRISPPLLIIGRGSMISTLSFKRLVIPLNTQYGEVQIAVALKESENAGGNIEALEN